MIFRSDLPSVTEALNGIRVSLEDGPRHSERISPLLTSAYLSFEAIRLPFQQDYQMGRLIADVSYMDTRVRRLASNLIELIQGEDFTLVAESIPYIRSIRRRERPMAPDMDFILGIRSRSISLYEFIRRLIDTLHDGVIDTPDLEYTPQASDDYLTTPVVENLKKLIPAQKIAPVKFDILQGRLTIADSFSTPLPGAAKLASDARSELVRRGGEILDQLRGSNCDPRLVSSFSELQSYMESSENIIQVGLANLTFDGMRIAFSDELPDAVGAMLYSHSLGINMLLAQYPEWVDFSDNAVAAELTESDISEVSIALRILVEKTELHPEVATPEVPKTVKAIAQLLNNPKDASKRAALAAVRTLENAVIKIFGYVGEFAEKTTEKSIDTLSSTASRVISIVLLTTALSIAGNLSGIAGSVEGLGWVKDAAAIVRSQVESLTAK